MAAHESASDSVASVLGDAGGVSEAGSSPSEALAASARIRSQSLALTSTRPRSAAGLGSAPGALCSSGSVTSISPSVSRRMRAMASCCATSLCSSSERISGYGEVTKAYCATAAITSANGTRLVSVRPWVTCGCPLGPFQQSSSTLRAPCCSARM